MQNSKFVQSHILRLSTVLSMLFACKDDGPECLSFEARFQELKGAALDPEMCGISDQLDEQFNAEIAKCLSENVKKCVPAYGRFLAVPPGGDEVSLYAGFSDDQCSITILLESDPESANAAFTEVQCKTMNVPGETSLVALDQCDEKISYPYCSTASSS